jgi:hypothetical protein
MPATLHSHRCVAWVGAAPPQALANILNASARNTKIHFTDMEAQLRDLRQHSAEEQLPEE